MKGPGDTSNFDDFEETEPWVPYFNAEKSKNKAKQDTRFVGFTFKRVDDEGKFKNIASLFDEIEQARDKKKALKSNLVLENIDTPEDKRQSWIHKIPGNFAGTPKSPNGLLQPTLMVSPRKETLIKIPGGLNQNLTAIDKKYSITTNPQKAQVVGETSVKSKEGSSTGKMLYMGNYKKGSLPFSKRSSSNEPSDALRLKSDLKEAMGSPKKSLVANLKETLSSRKTQGLTETKKPDLLGQNLMGSPSNQTTTKKKGFAFLGLKFLNKSKP